MNARRQGLLATIVFCVVSTYAHASDELPGKQWRFDVLLDDKRIGYHTFEVQQDGAGQVLTTEASFDVKFLFVTAFRYRHQNTEVWREGCLSSIDAATDSNGKKLIVRGTAGPEGFNLQNGNSSTALPACVQSFAYWNPAVLESARLLNSQTGVYETVSVTFESREQILVAGRLVDALRYRLSAQAGDITLWYASTDGTWLGLEAPAKGGRKILYQAATVPGSGPSRQRLARATVLPKTGSSQRRAATSPHPTLK